MTLRSNNILSQDRNDKNTPQSITLGSKGNVTSLIKDTFQDLDLNYNMASSYLNPSGSKPDNNYDSTDFEGDLAYAEDLERWQSMYGPGKVDDNDLSTVWSEGVDGPGIGEVIVVGPVSFPAKISIFAGHGKSRNLFRANNRPKEIQFSIISSDEQAYGDGTVEGSISYRKLSIESERRIILEDNFDYQELPIKEIPVSNESQFLLAIQILSVYPGTKYDDTCIAEIKYDAISEVEEQDPQQEKQDEFEWQPWQMILIAIALVGGFVLVAIYGPKKGDGSGEDGTGDGD